MKSVFERLGNGWMLVIGGIGLLIALGVIIYGLRGDFSVVPGSIAATAPAPGHQRVTPTSVLRMDFPYAMDASSVEEHMTKPDGLMGQGTWDDNSYLFDPAQDLPMGASYVFTVSAGAERADGVPLTRPLTFSFLVAGNPAVIARIPAPDMTEVPMSGRVSLIFDRPMVALAQLQGGKGAELNANIPVELSPSVSGQWRWLGSSTLTFEAEEALDPATVYTVAVPAGIMTPSGDATDKDYTWTFSTERPRVLGSMPEQGTSQANLLGPKQEIELVFNQEMSLDALAKGLTVRPMSGDAAPLQKPAFGTRPEKGTDKEVQDKRVILVKPSAEWPRGEQIELQIAPGTLGAKGTLGVMSGAAMQFGVVGPFSAVSDRYEYGSVYITFSTPVDYEALKKHITISNLTTDDWSGSANEWSDGTEVSLYVSNTKPSTTYTVTVGKSAKDKFGQTITAPYTFTFKTPPLEPQATVLSNGEFGIFERGKTPIFYLNGVNVSRLDVEFAKISLEEFLSMRNERRYNWNYKHDLARYEDYRSWQLPMQNDLNSWQHVPFDIEEKTGKSLSSGIYVLAVQAPEAKDYAGQPLIEYQFFTLTRTALTLKYSGDRALVWATDMQTGEPVMGANVTIKGENGKEGGTGKTDKDGFFDAALPLGSFGYNEWEPPFWVTAEKDGDFAFVGNDWGNGIRPWDFGYMDDFWGPMQADYRLSSYVYTDRPMYRGGDTVQFKGILRLRDRKGTMTSPRAGSTVHVTVTDALGNEVTSQDLRMSEYGAFAGSLTLSEEGTRGDYTMQATLSDVNVGYDVAYGTFSMLDYRKPEYKVGVTFDEKEYFAGDTVKATIDGAYYFGMPMAGASVAWRAQSEDYYFNRYTDGWYSFSAEEMWCWWGCVREVADLTEGKGVLDDNGKLKISIPASLEEKKLSQIVSVEADVADPNNQLVSNRASVPLHKADLYVGVRNQDYAVEPGKDANIDIVTVKPDGTPVPNQKVLIATYSRTWNTVRKKGVDGQYYYDNTPTDTFIRSFNAETNEGGKLTQGVTVPSGGEFRIIVTGKDGSGRVASAGVSVYGWSSSYFNWPHTNSDRFEVIADKPEYKVGDTAKLLVKSPYQGKGVKALVTVEREQVIQKWIIDVASNAQALEIPITEDMLPNVFVSVLVVKPRAGETFDEQGMDTGLPRFKIGYAQLGVETSKKKIDVTIETDKPKYLPGEKVNVTLTTRNSAGQPVPGDVSLAVVDMSVLALAGFEMPDPVSMFFSNRGLGIHTAQMLTYILERFKPGSKGGGGGGLETKTRGNFKDTAYWNASIKTDAEGRATRSFTLPDDLTTWHFLAIAQTKDHTFGAMEHTVIETKNVIVRPVQPRFAVHGDTMKVGAIVLNDLSEARDFAVKLGGEGFEALGNLSETVRINSGEQKKVEFSIRVKTVDTMDLRFSAETQGALDEVVHTLPVLPFLTAQSVATAGMTDDTVTEHIYPPTEDEAKGVQLMATVSPTVATYLPKGLEYVTKFPYGCAEQTVSSFLPNVAVSQLQGFDAFQIVDDKTLKNRIESGLQTLYTFQRGDGGFGYWAGSWKSYPYLTAYIVFALQEARDGGYTVDRGVLDRAYDYLNAELRVSKKDEPLDLATRAYILYVLAEDGKADMGLLENLQEQYQKLPLFSRAQLAMAFQNVGTAAAKKKANALVDDLLSNVRIDPRGAHFEETDNDMYAVLMHTNTRTTAFVLQSLLRIRPDDSLTPRIVRYLLAVRQDGHWDTTQSTTMSILALVDYLRHTGELDADFTVELTLAGTKVLEADFDAKNVLDRMTKNLAGDELQRGKDNALQIKKTGKGVLYYDLLLSYLVSADRLPPLEQGMGIEREIAPVGNAPKDLTVGNTYKVTLTITVPQDRHFVAVESPLPAGLEGVDLALKTTQQDLYGEEFEGSATGENNPWSWWDEEDPLRYFTHTEMRDDKVFLFADELPAGVYTYEYLARATTPGTYKLRPARAYEMYFPEVFGQSAGETVEVR